MGAAALLMAVAAVPDLDIIAESVGLAEHRGASHSLGFALLVAGAAFIAARVTGRPGRWWAAATFVAIGSHGVLDLFTPGPAVELLWPVTEIRIAAPFRPLPTPPIGDLLSTRGAALLAIEALIFTPVVAVSWWLGRRMSDRTS